MINELIDEIVSRKLLEFTKQSPPEADALWDKLKATLNDEQKAILVELDDAINEDECEYYNLLYRAGVEDGIKLYKKISAI